MQPSKHEMVAHPAYRRRGNLPSIAQKCGDGGSSSAVSNIAPEGATEGKSDSWKATKPRGPSKEARHNGHAGANFGGMFVRCQQGLKARRCLTPAK